MSVEPGPSNAREQELEALVARMRQELTATSEKLTTTSQKLASVTSERDNLRRAYRQLMEQFELLRRRIFIAKAERVDTSQLELEFAATKRKLDELAQQLAGIAPADIEGEAGKEAQPDRQTGSRPSGKPTGKPKHRPKGRRNLADADPDATGVAIRPEPLADGRRQACRRGHFFVVLADKKHIFFEYQPKHTSAAVCEMFRGFSGYVQADAHAIYDALFRGDAVDDDRIAPTEVACWSHARRRFWEAAVSGFSVAREGLLRVRKLYELDQAWSELPPAARLQKRTTVLRPLVDEFFDWVRAQNDITCQDRGLVRKALGYALRQELALRRFLEDGRLRMDNNLSENALRVVATGRKAWLFFGSHDHAQAAANLYSLIASCKLHGLDPERYLAEVIRTMPHWPRERYLELAPAYWAQTRARLVPSEINAELGLLTVPAPASHTSEQSPAD